MLLYVFYVSGRTIIIMWRNKNEKKNNTLFQSVINIVKNQNIGKTQKKNKPITFAAKMVGGGTNISSEMYLHRIAVSHDRNMENAPETERATRD